MSVTLSISSLSTEVVPIEALSIEALPEVEYALLRQDVGPTALPLCGFSGEATSFPTRIIRQRASARGRRAVSARHRRFRMDWEASAVILLMVVSAAVCVYRIMWAIYV